MIKQYTYRDYLPTKDNLFVWLNAAFLIGLLIFGLVDSLTIVMAYFLETIIIGLIYALKLSRAKSYVEMSSGNKEIKKTGCGLVLFFLVHYMFFVTIQLIFVFVFMETQDTNIKQPLFLIQNITYVLSYKGMKLVLASIIIYNLADYFINYLGKNIYEKIEADKIFMQPYIRIFIQQFAVILAGFFIFLLPGLMIVAILLILFRTIIELYFVNKTVSMN